MTVYIVPIDLKFSNNESPFKGRFTIIRNIVGEK